MASHQNGLDSAKRAMLDEIAPLGSERVALARAGGRVLAERVCAVRSAPPFSCSAMDGYAIRASESSEALEVVQTLFAGESPKADLAPGQAARIFTGAPLPPGADTVVREEVARVEGGRVRFTGTVRLGENVRQEGEDVPVGGEALPAGVRLGPRQIGLCAAVCAEEVVAVKRPRVVVIATGDEIVTGRTPNSNGAVIAAALEKLGVQVTERAMGDDLDRLTDALREAAADRDAVITVGGVSVGEKDFVPTAVERAGGAVRIHGVPMKPGKPFLFGRIGGTPVFGLPGSPSACLVAFEVFARPAVLRLSGLSRVDRPVFRLPLAEAVSGRAGRVRFLWGRIEGGRVRPLGRDASQMRGPALADALIRIPEGQAELPEGEEVSLAFVEDDP